MSAHPFEPIECDVATTLGSLLTELSKDCDELAAHSARGKPGADLDGLAMLREVIVTLQSLNQTLQGR